MVLLKVIALLTATTFGMSVLATGSSPENKLGRLRLSPDLQSPEDISVTDDTENIPVESNPAIPRVSKRPRPSGLTIPWSSSSDDTKNTVEETFDPSSRPAKRPAIGGPSIPTPSPVPRPPGSRKNTGLAFKGGSSSSDDDVTSAQKSKVED